MTIKSNLCSKCNEPVPCKCARNGKKKSGDKSASKPKRSSGGRSSGRSTSAFRYSRGTGGISGNAGYYDDQISRRRECEANHSRKFIFDITCDCGAKHEVTAQFNHHHSEAGQLIDIFTLDQPLLCACGLLTTRGRVVCDYADLYAQAVQA